MAPNPTPFESLPEYDGLLEQIASTDLVDAEWTRLREIIKYKLDKNISLYLSQMNGGPPPIPPPFSPRALPSGGLKLAPFGPRPNRGDGQKFPEPPKLILTQEEANEYKESIYAQLNEFDGAPFTIQRVCELCLHPTKNYKYLGKYLRAVEKSLLVTSTWESFPLPIESDTNNNSTIASGAIGNTRFPSTPSTPLFSPIPFLHDDARRSQSRSPPPSPLMLAQMENTGPATALPRGEGSEPKGLGLVDELDDPSPGHLSEHPHALSATTTVGSKPLLGSLEERFVKSAAEESKTSESEERTAEPAAEAEGSKDSDDMVVDDPEKENKAS